jgi:hypothetical protein
VLVCHPQPKLDSLDRADRLATAEVPRVGGLHGRDSEGSGAPRSWDWQQHVQAINAHAAALSTSSARMEVQQQRRQQAPPTPIHGSASVGTAAEHAHPHGSYPHGSSVLGTSAEVWSTPPQVRATRKRRPRCSAVLLYCEAGSPIVPGDGLGEYGGL